MLYAIVFLLWANADGTLEAWVIVTGWWKTYVIGWIILWLINAIIRPILKILALPLYLVFLGLVTFVINGIVIKLLDYIMNNLLMIDGVSYHIEWLVNFIIAVAIFTILNTLYSFLFSKKS
jgi:putative membrane protein